MRLGMQNPSRSLPMLYSLYQTAADMMLPLRVWATAAGQGLSGGGNLESWRATGALCEMMSRATLTHRRPSFGITESKVGNRVVPVREEEVFATPFGTLLRFAKEGAPAQPRVLLVAPMSGHFATLLRDTVRTMLADHDVHVTDWHSAREIPLAAGRPDRLPHQPDRGERARHQQVDRVVRAQPDLLRAAAVARRGPPRVPRL